MTEFMSSMGPSSNDPIQGVLLTPLSDTGLAGDEIQLNAAAIYYGGRQKENITSCFSCPTVNNLSEGTVSYEVIKGPGHMSGSKLVVNEDAKIGDAILLQASYHDDVSNTTAESMLSLVTVNPPVLMPAAPEEAPAETSVEAVPAALPATEKTPVTTESTSEPTPVESVVAQEVVVAKDEDYHAAAASANSALFWILGILVLLALAAMIAKRRLLKIDHEAPEHRAKENELYEAFGELHIPHEEPANHEERQKEVEAAFSETINTKS